MAKTESLEQNFEQLDSIVKKLESGELTINDAFEYYKKGIELIGDCNKKLDKVEKQIIVLSGKEDISDGIQ